MNQRFLVIAADIQRRNNHRFGWGTPDYLIDTHIWSIRALRGDDALGVWSPDAEMLFRTRPRATR